MSSFNTLTHSTFLTRRSESVRDTEIYGLTACSCIGNMTGAKERRAKVAGRLVLEDGSVFNGWMFGARRSTAGEVGE